MDYEFEILDKIVAVKTHGELNVEFFPGLLEEAIKLLTENSDSHFLADHLDSPTVKLSANDVEQISLFASRLHSVLDGKKFAAVVKTDFDFGMGRMWMSLTELNVKFEVSVFKDLDQAKSWLLT